MTGRKLATIVAVDMAGYSALTEQDDALANEHVAQLRQTVVSIADACGGRVFNTAGDGFMIEFGSGAAAVDAVIRLADECEPKVRVGAHLGDVLVQHDGDLLGHGVNVAARLMALAAPGTAVISADVRRTVRGASALRFAPRGKTRLPKMSEGIEIFEFGGESGVRGFLRLAMARPAVRRSVLAGTAAVLLATTLLVLSQVQSDRADFEPSVAVLAFADLSVGGDQAYFADGISEEILSTLARVDGLRVAGRTSSFAFKGSDEDLRSIGRSLGVAHVLEGSVRRAGDRIRVTARLTRANDGLEVWGQAYDRQLTDVLDVQQEIARSIARELHTSLGENAFRGGASTTNTEAYEAYLRGRSLFWTRSSVAQAAAQFERAVELDPMFAAAWAALADVYIAIPSWLDEYEGAPPDSAVFQRRAERAARRALELNPRLAATHHALSVVYRDRWQWTLAEDAIHRAIEIEPGSPYLWEDRQELLENVGRWRESAEAIETAVRIDPLNPFYHAISGIAHWHLRNYDRAVVSMRRALDMNPGLQSFHVEYVALLLDAGRTEEAVRHLEACTGCDRRAADFMQRAIRHADAPRGTFAYGDALRSTFGDYVFRGLVGGDDLVLRGLETAVAAGELAPLTINNRAIAAVRSSARYKALVRATGLDAYWRERGWPSFCRPVGADDFTCRE